MRISMKSYMTALSGIGKTEDEIFDTTGCHCCFHSHYSTPTFSIYAKGSATDTLIKYEGFNLFVQNRIKKSTVDKIVSILEKRIKF